MNIFRKNKSKTESSSIIDYVDKKTRLLRARYDHVQHKKHKHLFSKREVNTPGMDPLCKVCAMPLSSLTLERKLEKSTERFRSAQASVKDRLK